MGVFNPSVLTKKGASLSAKAVAGIADLQFTRIALGDSVLTGDLSNLTDIGVIKQIESVSGISIEADNAIKTNAVFSNKDLATGYYIRAIGLYAEDPDEGEILYCVSTADESNNTADWMPPFTQIGLTALTIGMLVAVSDTSTVNLTISDTAYAPASTVIQLQIQVEEMAEAVENTVGGFTSLEQIGVNDAELRANDWVYNINTITTNCPYDSNWVLRLSDMAKNSNLFQSAIKNLEMQFGIVLYTNQRCSMRIEWITHEDYAHMIIDFFWGDERYQCTCVAVKGNGYQISDFVPFKKIALEVDHNIRSYNSLEPLGLSEDDFYVDKWSTNVRRIDSYTSYDPNWVLTYGGIANTSKLLTSAINNLNSIFTADASSRTTDSYISLKIEKFSYTDYITLSIECTVGGKTYKCSYYDEDGTYAVQPFEEVYTGKGSIMFGSHNKPNSTYVGDGTSKRTISLGAVGNCIIIWTSNAVCIVHNLGAQRITGDIASINGVTFIDGTLTVGGSLNTNAVTYYYQVL